MCIRDSIDTSGFERAGAAYGQMFQNVGKTVAETIQKYEDKKMRNEAATALSAKYGLELDLAKTLTRQDNVMGGIMAMESLEQFDKTLQLQRELAESRIKETAQRVAQAGETFGGALQLQQLAITGKKQEIEQEKERFPRILRQVEATTGGILATTALTKAQTLAIPEELKIATDRLAIAKTAEERLQAHQSFNQDMAVQQQALAEAAQALKAGDSKAARELATAQHNLNATNQAFRQMATWREQNRLAGKDELSAEQWKHEFNLRKAQFNKSYRLNKGKLNVAEKQLNVAISAEKSTAEVNKARANYYDALAEAGPTQSTSEFERSINKLDLTPEQKQKLYRKRAETLAGITPDMTTQMRLKLFGGFLADGLTYETWDQVVGAAEKGQILNERKVTIREVTRKDKDGNPVEVQEIKGYDDDARPFTVYLTPGIKKTLEVYRQLQQGVIEGGGTGVTPDTDELSGDDNWKRRLQELEL